MPEPTALDIELNTALGADQRARYQDSRVIERLLATAKVVAVVGMSTETTKASNMVGSYLIDEGYEVYPVNPRAQEILGIRCYPDLASLPNVVDIVDVFRPASEVSAIVDAAISIGAKAVWTQLRIVDLVAADRAMAAGLDVVVDKCVKMEHGRFNGMLHWAGMNTEVVSARRRG